MSSSSQNSIFRQQQLLYRSSHYLAKDKQPTFYKPPSPDSQLSKENEGFPEDEEMGIAETLIDPSNNNNTTTNNNNIEKKKETETIHYTKRNRTSVQKQYPITKLLATMDKDKLVELINDLVDANPHLLPEVDAHLPQPKES